MYEGLGVFAYYTIVRKSGLIDCKYEDSCYSMMNVLTIDCALTWYTLATNRTNCESVFSFISAMPITKERKHYSKKPYKATTEECFNLMLIYILFK